jgi:hypothetical protein
MKTGKSAVKVFVLFALLASAAFADDVTVHYDHQVNFDRYKTYSWEKAETANPIEGSRLKNAVEKALSARGWTELPSGGEVTLVALEKNHTTRQMNFVGYYDVAGTLETYTTGALTIYMLDATSNNLIWKATSTGVLSDVREQNDKNMDRAVRKMFKHFPTKPVSSAQAQAPARFSFATVN